MASFVSLYAEIILFPNDSLPQQAWCASIGHQTTAVIAHYSDRRHTHVLLHFRNVRELSQWTQSLHSSTIPYLFFSHHIGQVQHCMARISKQKAYHEWISLKEEILNLADYYEWEIDDTTISQLLDENVLGMKKGQRPPQTPFGGAN